MGIYITGMGMPKSCISCPFMISRDNDDCILQSEEANESFENWEQMKAGCPLVEVKPHGRLGDLDEMAVDESEAYVSAQLKLGDDVLTKAINEAVHAKIVRLIADTPTIIPPDPAEEEPT